MENLEAGMASLAVTEAAPAEEGDHSTARKEQADSSKVLAEAHARLAAAEARAEAAEARLEAALDDRRYAEAREEAAARRYAESQSRGNTAPG
jgi:hypothetical protein